MSRHFAALASRAVRAPLVREHIHRHLYDPDVGYFSRQVPPVGLVGQSLPFGSLHSRAEYQLALHHLYQKLQVAWLTPAEIFSPTFGRGIANCILQHHAALNAQQPLRIVEIGGGNGTLARDMLDFFREASPEVYRSCSFTSLEISATLAKRQQQHVAVDAGHAGVFAVRQGDALVAKDWGRPSDDHTFVVACEVLDNMPHDRVCWSGAQQNWLQTHIQDEARLVLAPAADDVILECLAVLGPRLLAQHHVPLLHRLFHRALGGDEGVVAFLPTGAWSFLKALNLARPSHCLVAADFNELPDVTIQGQNAPLVSSTVGGKATDHSTLLVPAGSADIFFPTDFAALQDMFAAATMHEQPSTCVTITGKFMQRFADRFLSDTACGPYQPLVEDFTNTSIFMGSTAGLVTRL